MIFSKILTSGQVSVIVRITLHHPLCTCGEMEKFCTHTFYVYEWTLRTPGVSGHSVMAAAVRYAQILADYIFEHNSS